MPQLNHELNKISTTAWLNFLTDQPNIAAMSESKNIIKERLAELGKRQAWLAEIAGVSVNAVSKWTKGGPIASENVVLVADALGITTDQLLKGTQLPTDSRTDLVKLSPIERRLVELFKDADDRGKLEMMAAIEEIAKDIADERRRAAYLASKGNNQPDDATSRVTLVKRTAKVGRRN